MAYMMFPYGKSIHYQTLDFEILTYLYSYWDDYFGQYRIVTMDWFIKKVRSCTDPSWAELTTI